jgi:hypothetical protein
MINSNPSVIKYYINSNKNYGYKNSHNDPNNKITVNHYVKAQIINNSEREKYISELMSQETYFSP